MIDFSLTKIILGAGLFTTGTHLTGMGGVSVFVLGIIILYDSFHWRKESLNHL